MTFGLRIENPSTGAIVVSSDAITYRYMGAPTLITAAGFTPTHNPYLYRVTMPSTTAVPMVAIVLDAARVSVIQGVYRTSGSPDQWDILVFSAAVSGCTDKTTIALSAPVLRVFCPPASAGGSWGLQLFNAAHELTADFSYTPLWVQEVVNFPARADSYTPTAWGGAGLTYLNGDEQALSDATAVAIIGGSFGSAEEFWGATGEGMNYWLYGWTLSGSNLRRQRFWQSDSKPATTFDPAYDSLDYVMTATKALIVDSTLLV